MANSSTRVPISKRLVLINSLSTVGTRILTVGAFAWVVQYLMKRIPEDELALLPIALSFAMALPLIQTILNAGLARHVTEAYARDDMHRITQIVSSQFPLLCAGAGLVVLVGGLFTWWVDDLFSIPPDIVWKLQLMLALIVGRLAIGIVLSAFSSGLFANQKFVITNAMEVATSLLRVGLMVWLILGFGPEVHYVVIAQVVSQVVQAVAIAIVSMRMMPALRFRPSEFSWEVSKEVLTFGVWYLVMQLAQVIRRASDAPLLHLLASPLAVNVFFLGSFIELRVRELLLLGIQPLLPALTAMHAKGERERLGPAFLRGGRLALWVALAGAVPLAVCSKDLYQVYLGAEYATHADAATVLVLLFLAFPFTYPSLLLAQIAQATAEMRGYALLTFAVQLLNLLLTLVLVGLFGMGAVGAAASTLVIAIIANVFFFWPLALRTLDVSWRRFVSDTLAPGWMPALVATVVGWITLQTMSGSSALRLTVGMIVCLVTYVVVLGLSLRPVDRRDVVRLFQAVRLKFV